MEALIEAYNSAEWLDGSRPEPAGSVEEFDFEFLPGLAAALCAALEAAGWKTWRRIDCSVYITAEIEDPDGVAHELKIRIADHHNTSSFHRPADINIYSMERFHAALAALTDFEWEVIDDDEDYPEYDFPWPPAPNGGLDFMSTGE
jgi:hypothetical protein